MAEKFLTSLLLRISLIDAMVVDHTEKEAARRAAKEGGARERGNVYEIWEPALNYRFTLLINQEMNYSCQFKKRL